MKHKVDLTNFFYVIQNSVYGLCTILYDAPRQDDWTMADPDPSNYLCMYRRVLTV